MTYFVHRCVICRCADFVLYARVVCIYCYRCVIWMHLNSVVLVFRVVFCGLDSDFYSWCPPWGSNVWFDCLNLSAYVWKLLQYVFEILSVWDADGSILVRRALVSHSWMGCLRESNCMRVIERRALVWSRIRVWMKYRSNASLNVNEIVSIRLFTIDSVSQVV